MKAPMKGICLVACLLSSSPVALALDCRIAWDPNEAAAKVLALPDAKVTQADRWTIVAQKTGTLWAATKPSHAAHPAVVKRCVSSASGTRETSTAIGCLAAGSICAPLEKEFDVLVAKVLGK
jgi:hypothetical protein